MSTRSFFSRVAIRARLRRSSSDRSTPPCGRLYRAHKRTNELPIDLRTHRIRIKSRRSKKLPRLLSLVNPRWLHLNGFEALPRQLLLILLYLQRPRDAPDPQFHALPDLRRHLAAHHHVRNSQPPSRL